ncbi:hypothetical protein BDA99DRAFT_537118 [Phascolomyces articulosus]|uniref:Uncharacterized protein n=1 Tax=Phascolomyces articulosus TaxID=60185 RepID=A0AAD5KD75_9FUNG|nr:hypothetical protein BDA99DRAFT_537118 [Phascolomyces articulosus]
MYFRKNSFFLSKWRQEQTMLDNNSKTLSTNGKRPPLRLKKIFCPSMHHRSHKDNHQEMAISPPLMGPPHHQNTIYSLVSPTRPTHSSLFMGTGDSATGNNSHHHRGNDDSTKRPTPRLNSVPPRVSSMPKQRMPRRSTIGAPRNELPLFQQENKIPITTQYPPEPPKKSSSRPSRLPRPSTSTTRTTEPPRPKTSLAGSISKTSTKTTVTPPSSTRGEATNDRRHSFHVPPHKLNSSSLSINNNSSISSIRTAPPANHSRLADIAYQSSISTSTMTSSTTLCSTSSSTSNTSSTSSSSLSKKKKQQNRQSRAAAAATMPPGPQLQLQKSRSTPLRRIKAYNVDYNHQSEMERRRKQKELEELIAGGRRGSTLKLSLTPRGL